jgi:hypothetical protein
MVNAETGMLGYLYIPKGDRFVRENCPSRDIVSVWEVELLGQFSAPAGAAQSRSPHRYDILMGILWSAILDSSLSATL